MLEFKCIIPLQKDLRIVVKDYDLLTSDDPIGETTIDLENRLLSRHRAVCGIHRTHFTLVYTLLLSLVWDIRGLGIYPKTKYYGTVIVAIDGLPMVVLLLCFRLF